MRRILGTVVAVALLSAPLFGQSAPPTPSFDIADVHAGSRNPGVGMTGGLLREGRYELHNATMVDLIRTAYSVDAEKVVGGPSWLELDKFTIIAKAPQTTPAPTVKLMLQSLLADRFKLVVHQDTRPLTAYAMTLAGGKHKMKEAAGPGQGCQPQPPQTPEPGVIPPQVGICRGITMEAFAQLLPRIAGQYLTAPLVIDQTGLKEAWDFEIRFHGRGQLAQAGTEGISIFDALEKQLGLKLELKESPQSALVVDSVNRTSTANSPEVAKVLPPPPPPEFEAAEIKPSGPDSKGPNANIRPTGLLTAQAMPLKQLIFLAWNINSDDLIDGPKWLDSARFDMVARAFASTSQTDMPPVEIDTLREMLKALLIERFQMKTHVEDRQVSGYVLSAEKPRLTKADPSSRTKCMEGPAVANAADPRNRNPILSRLITCQNTTMAQFAERLMYVANGYVRVPALDATGLEGGWNFSVNFSPIGAFQGGRGGDGAGPPAAGGSAGALTASDPNGAISLPEALDKQLGLKLELKKRPLPVLVIDSIQEKPVEH
jgi:uncharacterized protein (TIGR03435 family)